MAASPSRRPRPVWVAATLVVAIVGLADAAIEQAWDLFALFLVLVALQIVPLLTAMSNRVTVSLRPDLARWVVRRSQRTGEPIDDVIDRSVAWFQHGLYGAGQGDGR